uniref:LAGLIDADG_2 domain-containing protein n=1 Tax=Heterorhabditis bacteriophora TaxID=37862 RepID=A0A1I7WUE8_HETBA
MAWVDHGKTLREQGVTEDETLLLRRKYFFRVSTPSQKRQLVIWEHFNVRLNTAIFQKTNQSSILNYAKSKDNEKKIVQKFFLKISQTINSDGYYSVKTADGEKIGQLIGGYIDIIMKKKRMKDHLGIEGDEGSTMLEDIVAPAKATLVKFLIFNIFILNLVIFLFQAQDINIALRGVLRTPQTNGFGYGYGINGAQYGAVSGDLQGQSMAKVRIFANRIFVSWTQLCRLTK